MLESLMGAEVFATLPSGPQALGSRAVTQADGA